METWFKINWERDLPGTEQNKMSGSRKAGWEGWLCRSSSRNTLISDQPWTNLWTTRLELSAENCASVVSVAVRALCQPRRLWKRAGFGVLLASSPATPMGTRDKLIWMCFTLSDNQIPSEKKEIQDYCPDPCSPNKNDGGESTCRSWHTLGLWYLFLLPLSFSFLFPNPPEK